MYDLIYQESLKRAKNKVWLFSDLQQSNPVFTQECLKICMEDFDMLGAPVDMIWYLGDAVEGCNKEHLIRMTELQETAFSKNGIPLCYVLGNHDFDYARIGTGREEPVFSSFYEMVKQHEGWYTLTDYTKPYFKVKLGNYRIYFLSAHIASDRSWGCVTGELDGEVEKYPYNKTFQELRQMMIEEKCPVITASHYSFPGGNRASGWLGEFLPLPRNVKLHVYGHAHIGDVKWAGADAYRRISWVNWQDVPQVNVSSFENIRGIKCRSVFLHIYEDDSMGIFFRNHDDHAFTECYFPAKFPIVKR